jgi:hypothetical protein
MSRLRSRRRAQANEHPRVILLFDQNLSFRLTRALADIYPGALHVKHLGLTASDDKEIWLYAAVNDLCDRFEGLRFLPTKLAPQASTEGLMDSPRKLLDQGR